MSFLSDPSVLPATAPNAYAPIYEADSARAIVLINGIGYVPLRYSITFNAHGATDEASVTFPIRSSNPDFVYPDFTQAIDNTDTDAPVYVEIRAGFSNLQSAALLKGYAQLNQRFLGVIDTYPAAFHENTVTFACRSLAAPLVDNEITKPWTGKTSVDFVNEYAGAQGLTPNIVLNPGTTPITIQEMLGREFISGAQFNTALYRMKPWDVMLQTAHFDDVDVWVDKDVLNYCAPNAIARNKIALQYGSNLKDLTGTHSTAYSRNVQVEVRTYQKKIKQSTVARMVTDLLGGVSVVTRTTNVTSSPVFGTSEVLTTSISATGAVTSTLASSSGGSFKASTQPGSESGKQRYIYYIPNLTPARASALAQALWRRISQHEYSIETSLPVTQALLAQLSITSLLELTGVPYARYNTQYWPRRIEESFDLDGGWTWSIQALNHTPPMGGV